MHTFEVVLKTGKTIIANCKAAHSLKGDYIFGGERTLGEVDGIVLLVKGDELSHFIRTSEPTPKIINIDFSKPKFLQMELDKTYEKLDKDR